ncbi:PAS domain-containing protein [Yinghuangia sp. YIM S09857]|uniref:PAS domain-containing protein n=1 Tax=Yinghuangia sp. YIM S09857 TaxID=3436929 RepID=UPI003F52AB82
MSSRPSRGAARLAAILDALPDALLLVNRNGTVVNANAMALEALEAPGTPIVGRGLLDLLPTFDRSRIPGSVRAMDASDTRTKPTRMTARRTDGSLMPVEVTSANLPGAYDDELLMIVVRDLSGSVDVESELQRQQRQTEMILRAASEGIVGIDAEGSIVLVNPAAARILRHRASDLGGKSLHELLQPKKADGTPMPPDDCPALVTLKTGRKQRLRDQVLWRGDGEPLPVEMTTAPILLGEAVVGAVMTFTDTSRERTLAEHREQLAELLDAELLARIEASRARLKTLADGSIGELGPSARRVVRQVAGELEEMAGLTGEVLEHQRGEKKDGVERTAATVDDLLDRALETVTYPARAAGVEFTVTAAAVGVQVDVDAMTRALGHLIADTVGAGPKGSTVVVAAAQRGGKARIEVRGPASRGSSVHVPLARSVIEAHGGTVESHAVEGRGSTYVVELPADDEAAAKARPQDAAEEGKDVRARARKRARTSPAVRPGTAAAKPADKPDEKSGEKSGEKSDEHAGRKSGAGADGGTGGSDTAGRNAPANDGGSTPRLPAARGENGNANAGKDGSGSTGTGNGTGLEPADPAGPPAATPPSLPAAAKPIALPAGESTAPPGTAPSVPLVPASGGRRAARRALPSTEGPENAGNSGNAANSQGAMALPAGPSGGVDPGQAGPRHGGAAEQGQAAHGRTEHGLPENGAADAEVGQPDEAEPGVPAKVNGRHTPHMARARHQMSTPPAAIPSQSRPGNPGAGSRSTSVQDRPDRTGQPDLAPTELLDMPGLPQAPGPDADAPTALMPHIPFAPGEPSATPNPAATPTAPPPIPPMPTAPPPAPGAAESGTSNPAPDAPRTPFTGRRRRALAPAQQPESQPGQPGHEQPPAAESEARGDERASGPYALPPAYGDAVVQPQPQPQPPQGNSGAMRAFAPPPGNAHGRGPTHIQGGQDQGVTMPFPGTGYGPGAPADGELGSGQGLGPGMSALDLPQRTPGAAPHPGTVREPAQPDPHSHPGHQHHPAEPAGQQGQQGQQGQASQQGQSAQAAHQALQAAAAQLAPAQAVPAQAPAPEAAPAAVPHAPPHALPHALPPQPNPGPTQPAQQPGQFPPHLPAGYDVDTPPPGELAAVDPNYPPMVAPTADGRPRRLLVWPSPDGPTSSALTARGWDPVLVRSREEVDASTSAHPAALFVDPLTGPITRTALQSLRTAATAAHIPVLVTAGLMQATRDAAFGADPAVLLRSLAPADSAAHASRVLLVEANQDIATAFTGSLVRRGMDVVHVTSESEAVSKASSVEPNLVVLDLMLVRRRRLGIVDWLRNNQRLHSTPIVVYTTVDIAPEALPRLQTGETVLFLAERSTRDDVQQRVVDLLGKIASLV